MSEDKNDRPVTPPELIDPPERVAETSSESNPAAASPSASEHSSDEIQPEVTSEPTQSEIAAEQAEASLDARDEAAHDSHDDHDSRDDTRVSSYDGAAADSRAGEHPQPTPVAPVVAPVAASTAASAPVVASAPAATSAYAPVPVSGDRPAQDGGYPSTQQAPIQQAPMLQAPMQQRAFTAPPVQPKKKGNRGIGALIALFSVIIFLVLFAIVAAIIIGVAAPGRIGENLTEFLSSPVFFVPAIFFVVGFVLVVLLANRANWWAYILGSLFVAALVYFGTIAVGLLLSNVVVMTPAQAAAEFANSASNPFVIAGALVAREVSMWIGAAISARGRRMKARNLSAREEYERAAAEHRAEYERGFAPA